MRIFYYQRREKHPVYNIEQERKSIRAERLEYHHEIGKNGFLSEHTDYENNPASLERDVENRLTRLRALSGKDVIAYDYCTSNQKEAVEAQADFINWII